MTLKTLTAAAALATLAGAAFADDTATVQVFYDLLSNPGSQEHVAAFQEATSEDWASIGDYSGAAKSHEAFLGQMGGFAQLIPDLQPDARIGQHRNVIEAAKSVGVKKIVYTSIQGPEQGTSFSPIVQSNRQTEADIRASGLIGPLAAMASISSRTWSTSTPTAPGRDRQQRR